MTPSFSMCSSWAFTNFITQNGTQSSSIIRTVTVTCSFDWLLPSWILMTEVIKLHSHYFVPLCIILILLVVIPPCDFLIRFRVKFFFDCCIEFSFLALTPHTLWSTCSVNDSWLVIQAMVYVASLSNSYYVNECAMLYTTYLCSGPLPAPSNLQHPCIERSDTDS